MPYGDNTTAYKLLTQGACVDTIKATGKQQRGYPDVYVFSDGSSIELSKWGRHQARLSNGWNVTPR